MLILFILWPSKIRVSQTGVVSTLSPPRWRISSGQHRHAVSRFLRIKLRRAHYLHFILWQRFICSPPLSSQNWRIESAPPPQSILRVPPDSQP
jgi:hypothetical protein